MEKLKRKKEIIVVVCPYCEYFWSYAGNLDRATCPNCSNKVKLIPENKTTYVPKGN